jgi:2-methylisocitrate lyase-like PEP mutase family enzyme
MALETLFDEGIQTEIVDLMLTREELYELLDYEEFEERDRAYFGRREETDAVEEDGEQG